ncbi:MAG: xanthine dehydrogenase family protein subunit M [Gemmatimonadetes bacterium]|nr:xanthine dehydrogenase family protein subunit M [Gemmatimonadota bacterium]
MSPFEYHRPNDVAEAIALLGELGDDALLIAGGQNLVPLMRSGGVTPRHLIDIRRIVALSRIREERHAIVIGAATTHTSVVRSDVIRQRLPVVSEVAELAGDPAVRNIGTIGGNLAQADRSSDWPAVVLALGADIAIAGAQGERRVPAASFFRGPFGTALEPAEMITSIRFRMPPARTGSAYVKEADPATGFAFCGVAAMLTLDETGIIGSARIAITVRGQLLVRATAAESALAGLRPSAETISLGAAHVTSEARAATVRAIAHALERIA